MNSWLDETIPVRKALGALLMTNGVWMIKAAIDLQLMQNLERRLADAEQRVEIMKESTLFLLEHADDRTAHELNDKLDFWRIVRGMETKSDQ